MIITDDIVYVEQSETGENMLPVSASQIICFVIPSSTQRLMVRYRDPGTGTVRVAFDRKTSFNEAWKEARRIFGSLVRKDQDRILFSIPGGKDESQ